MVLLGQQLLKCFISKTSYCAKYRQTNQTHIAGIFAAQPLQHHRQTYFYLFAKESINTMLVNTVPFTKSVNTRYLLALKREQRGVSVSFYEVQEHPSFPGTKIFTLCVIVFFCEVGTGLQVC